MKIKVVIAFFVVFWAARRLRRRSHLDEWDRILISHGFVPVDPEESRRYDHIFKCADRERIDFVEKVRAARRILRLDSKLLESAYIEGNDRIIQLRHKNWQQSMETLRKAELTLAELERDFYRVKPDDSRLGPNQEKGGNE